MITTRSRFVSGASMVPVGGRSASSRVNGFRYSSFPGFLGSRFRFPVVARQHTSAGGRPPSRVVMVPAMRPAPSPETRCPIGNTCCFSEASPAISTGSRRPRKCRTSDCRLQVADCRLQTADAGCRLQTSDCRPLIADCRLQTADRRLQIADCRLQTADRRLLIADWRLTGLYQKWQMNNQSAVDNPQSAICNQQSAISSLQSAICSLQSAPSEGGHYANFETHFNLRI